MRCLAGLSSHAFKHTITTRQGGSFKQIRQKDWNGAGSREKEEKAKNKFNKRGNGDKGGKHTNKLN